MVMVVILLKPNVLSSANTVVDHILLMSACPVHIAQDFIMTTTVLKEESTSTVVTSHNYRQIKYPLLTRNVSELMASTCERIHNYNIQKHNFLCLAFIKDFRHAPALVRDTCYLIGTKLSEFLRSITRWCYVQLPN